MIDLILSDAGELAIIVMATISAITCFVAFGYLNGMFVPIKRIYLLSFGFIGITVSVIYIAVYFNDPSRGLIAINRAVWFFDMLLIAMVAGDVIRTKIKVRKK